MKKHKIFLTAILLLSIASFSSCINKEDNKTTTPDISSGGQDTTGSKVPTEYEFKEIKWADDYSSASLVFKNNIDSILIDAKVTKIEVPATCDSDGKIIYTASGIYDNVTYTDTKEVKINKLDHEYEFDSIVWNGYTAQAKLVCKIDNNHSKYVNIEVTNKITKEATCENTGIKLYEAIYEGHKETKEEVIPKLNHDYKFDSFVWNEDYTCKVKLVCNNDNNHVIYKDAFVSSKDYSAPNCESDGKITYIASYENKTDIKTVTLEKLEHDYKFNSFIWDSINHTAKAKLVCSYNNNHETTVDAEVSSEITSEATYTSTGVITYTLKYGDNVDYRYEIIPILDYFNTFVRFDWVDDDAYAIFINEEDPTNEKSYEATVVKENIKDATCTDSGSYKLTATYKTYTDIKTVNVEALDHDYEFDSFVWDNEYNVKVKLVCKNDNNHITYVEPEIKNSQITIQPTCDNAGAKTYYASYYNYEDSKTEVLPKLGHNFKFDSFVWDDEYNALAKYVCQNDNSHENYFDATVTSEVITEATFSSDGVIRYTAVYQNNSAYIDIIIPAEGDGYTFKEFKWSEDLESAKAVFENDNDPSDLLKKDASIIKNTITNPTCEDDGVLEITAKYGTYSEKKNKTIGAIGHNFEFDSIVWEGYTAKAKLVCKNDNNHITYENCIVTNEITKQPTCEENGIKTYTATYLTHSQTKTETLEKLGHNYVFDSIVWEGFTAKAKLVCENDNSHVIYENCTVTSQTTKTCDTDGIKTYTATYLNHTSTKEAFDPATGHDFSDVEYVWTKSANTYICNAKRICKICNELESEEAQITINKTLATKTSVGKIVYTATFTNPLFETQTKEVNIYYVAFVDNDGNPTSSDNEYFDVEENQILSYKSVKIGSKTYKNPIISTSNNNLLTYAFNGWMVDDNLVNLTNYQIKANTIFKPKYVKYELKSNIDEAATLNGLTSDQYTNQSQISLYRNINDGYVFVGWYKVIGGEEIALVEASLTDSGNLKRAYLNESSDTIYLAKFIKLPININYDNTFGNIVIQTIDNVEEDGLWIGRSIRVSANALNSNIFTGFYNSNNELVYKNGEIPLSSFDVVLSSNLDEINLDARFIPSFITVKANDDTKGIVVGKDDTLIYGEEKEFVATPNEGYSFEGWYKNDVFYSSLETIKLTINESNSATYEARFTSYTITTTISDQAAGSITSYNNFKVEAGKSITIEAIANDGYTFLGWYNGASLVSNLAKYTFIMPKENINYEAKFTSYTLQTSNLNPLYGECSIYNKKVSANTYISLTATPKKGYTFMGWYDLDDNTLLTDELSYNLLMPYQSKNYEARFVYYTLTATAKDNLGDVYGESTSNIVSVTFNKNGGVGDIETQYVSNTTTLKYPNEITKEGYVFTGWYSDSSCNNLYDFTKTLTDNIILYAGFIKEYESGYNNQEVIDFTRLYNSNTNYYTLDLANTSSSKTNNVYFTVYSDSIINIYIKTKTSVAADKLNASIVNLTTSQVYNTSIYSDSINYVRRQIQAKCGDVICIKNYIESDSLDQNAFIYVTGNDLPLDGAVCGNIKYNNTYITAKTNYTLYATPKDGYTFDGWYIGDEKVSSNMVETFEKKKENETIEARFIYYTVSVSASYKNDDSNAGEIVNEYNLTKVSVGNTVNLKATLTEGYTFLGWYDGDDLVSSELEYSFTMPKNNINYVAKYTYYTITIQTNNTNAGDCGGVSDSNYVIVKFNTNSDTIIPNQIVKKTTPLSYPGNPVKEGYVFKGWYTDASCTELFDFNSYIKSNITLYAGYYEINLADAKSINVVDITKTAYNNDNAINIIETGSNVNSKNYTFISILVSGRYKMSYKNSSQTSTNGTFMKVYNVTTDEIYYDTGTRLTNTTYNTLEFEANAGDVIYVETYVGSNDAVATFTYLFVQIDGSNTVIAKTPNSTATCGALTYNNTKITAGSHVSLQATVNEGYEFIGWYKVDGEEIKLTSNLTYEITVSEYENGTYLAKYKLSE